MIEKKKTLILGASTNPERYSFIAANKLVRLGHPIVMFGLKNGIVATELIQTSFPTDSDFDTVTMYMNDQRQKPYEEKIISLKPKRIIFNPGAENNSLMKKANEAGIETVEACTLVLLSIGQY